MRRGRLLLFQAPCSGFPCAWTKTEEPSPCLPPCLLIEESAGIRYNEANRTHGKDGKGNAYLNSAAQREAAPDRSETAGREETA